MPTEKEKEFIAWYRSLADWQRLTIRCFLLTGNRAASIRIGKLGKCLKNLRRRAAPKRHD